MRRSSRIVFFSALYKYGVATAAEYVQVLKWLVLGGQPCMCRLLLLQTLVGSGDKHVYSLCGPEVDLVAHALGATDSQGYNVWEFDGRESACEVSP